jgi:hypothetical protein
VVSRLGGFVKKLSLFHGSKPSQGCCGREAGQVVRAGPFARTQSHPYSSLD